MTVARRAAAGPGQGDGDGERPAPAPAGTIPAGAIDVGYVSYRITRVTMEGSVYTIAPRLVMPTNAVDMPKDVDAAVLADGQDARRRRSRGSTGARSPSRPRRAGRRGAGRAPRPRGHARRGRRPGRAVGLRDRPTATTRDDCLQARCASTASPTSQQRPGRPRTAASRTASRCSTSRAADELMATAKELGFMGVVFYGTLVCGFNAYFKDAGRDEGRRLQGLQRVPQGGLHATSRSTPRSRAGFPYYVNLGDEPIGDDVAASAENAEAYRKAFPKGPPFFTGATSFAGERRKDPHFRLSKAAAHRRPGTATTRRRSSCSTRPAATGRSTTAATAGPSATTCTRPPSSSA